MEKIKSVNLRSHIARQMLQERQEVKVHGPQYYVENYNPDLGNSWIILNPYFDKNKLTVKYFYPNFIKNTIT